MSATGRTTNYDFPIYEPNDTISFLGSYNQTISDIDSTCKIIQTAAEDAKSTAESSHNDIDALQQSVVNLNNNIVTLNNNIKTLDSLLTFDTYSVNTAPGVLQAIFYASGNGVNMFSFRTTFILSGAATSKYNYQGSIWTLIASVSRKVLRDAQGDCVLGSGTVTGTIYPLSIISTENRSTVGRLVLMFTQTGTYIFLTASTNADAMEFLPASGSIFFGGKNLPMN